MKILRLLDPNKYYLIGRLNISLYFALLILILILILMLIFSCDKVKDTEKVVKYYEDGTIFSEYSLYDGSKNGKYHEYYNNGNIRLKCFFKDGLHYGNVVSYFKNGNVRIKYQAKNGTRIGEEYSYLTNGNLKNFIIYDEQGSVVYGKEYQYSKNNELIDSSVVVVAKLVLLEDEIFVGDSATMIIKIPVRDSSLKYQADLRYIEYKEGRIKFSDYPLWESTPKWWFDIPDIYIRNSKPFKVYVENFMEGDIEIYGRLLYHFSSNLKHNSQEEVIMNSTLIKKRMKILPKRKEI